MSGRSSVSMTDTTDMWFHGWTSSFDSCSNGRYWTCAIVDAFDQRDRGVGGCETLCRSVQDFL
jgi:hypothetical protein